MAVGALADASMRVREFAGEASEWDAFARRQQGFTPFHLHAWKRVVEEVFGHDCLYLEARDSQGALGGILPLVHVRSVLFGHYLVSMPFVNYGGPIGTDAGVRALGARAVAFAVEEGADLLEMRSRGPLPLTLPVSHRKITVLLDLPADPAVLWKDLKSKVRSQVRRPRKAGMTLSFGPDELEPFHQVFSRHMRDLGTPVMPRRFFESLRARLFDEVRFACVYADGAPVAAGCGFRWGEELEITWASSLREHSRDAPNMLLYWGFMERAIEEGCRLFNFGRCTPDSGTHRFKSQWGSRDEPLHWYQHGESTQGTPSPEEGPYAWGPRVWQRLPLPVANFLGPRIVKYLP